MIELSQITGFDWDDGNTRKNEKHDVSMAEAEQVFFNAPLLVLEDGSHSQQEARLHALGKTDGGRTLHITFTLRQSGLLIRVISARDMHRKERAIYEQAD
ncbi:BrnT family toxin [Polaromonas sp.]|uniref:BrnT family toxin n=1 Tax=Polaromonas sp. TaxID=1869339 RepID=UPI001A22886C|nr:BrnT family toxin [Xanthomonadaceae bacterium]